MTPFLSMTKVERIRHSRRAEHHAVELAELVLVVGEIGGHQGAAGRAVARVEIDHHMLLAAERQQAHRLHVGVGKRERRRWLSWLQHVRRFYSKSFFN